MTYNIVERRMKLSNKAPFQRKIPFDFADNIELINF